MVGEGVKGGVAVVGVGVEGELCVCAEVLEGAGKQFGLGDHFPADLFGAVAAAFVFADADADGGVGGEGGREEVEDAAVVPPDGGGGEQVVFEAVGGGEEGIESEQCAEGVSEQGLFFGVDGVFGGKGGGKFSVEEGGEAVGLSVLAAFRFGGGFGQWWCVVEGALGQVADFAVGVADADDEAGGAASGHGVDEQGLRHAEGGGEEGVAVEDMEDGIALRGRAADSGGLDAVVAAGVLGADVGFFGLQQAGGLPMCGA